MVLYNKLKHAVTYLVASQALGTGDCDKTRKNDRGHFSALGGDCLGRGGELVSHQPV